MSPGRVRPPERRDPAAAASRLVALDGLRGIAAILVVYVHVATICGLPGLPSLLAVDLFFMLSGFVIPHAYERRLRDGLGFMRFVEIRLIRLYPLYILGCAIGLIPPLLWFAAEPHFGYFRGVAAALPWAIAMLPKPAIEAQHSFPLNPPAWTLFLEIVVNLAWAAVVPRLGNRGLIAVAVVSALALAVATHHFGTLDFGTGGLELLWGLSRVACPFSIGLLLHRLWSSGRLPAPRVPFAVPVALLVAAGLAAPGWWSGWLFVVLLLPAITVMTVAHPARGAAARRLTWLGDLSYPLYALHMPLIGVGMAVGKLAGYGIAPSTLATVPFVFAVALLAERRYDRPVRRRLAALADLRRQTVESAPAF